jgi:toxin ParE1/3/4
MRRARVVYRPEAVDDLEEIFRFVLDLSRDRHTARRFVERIRERCRRIGETPLGGTPRDDLAPGIRTVPFERRAVVAYRMVDGAVEITNIFYGGRDYEALYRQQGAPEG